MTDSKNVGATADPALSALDGSVGGQSSSLPEGALGSLLVDLFGGDPLPEEGVVQTAATTGGPGLELLEVLRIDEDSPKSRWDALLLMSARAWCDVIVSSGSIWRHEPDLSYLPATIDRQRWWEYRRSRGRTRPPSVVVLTSGRDFPLGHPALEEGFPVTLFGPPELRVRVDSASPVRRPAIRTDPGASASSLVGWWRRSHPGRSRVLIELGPQAASGLHLERLIDRMLLSIYREAGARSHARLLPAASARLYRRHSVASRNESRSGNWSHLVVERPHSGLESGEFDEI